MSDNVSMKIIKSALLILAVALTLAGCKKGEEWMPYSTYSSTTTPSP
jgi:predicted small lipoprotein YifL